jgi:hypothetical protein
MLHRIAGRWWFCTGYLVLSPPALSGEKSRVRLDDVSIHLFLETRGTFRDDATLVLGFSVREDRGQSTFYREQNSSLDLEISGPLQPEAIRKIH